MNLPVFLVALLILLGIAAWGYGEVYVPWVEGEFMEAKP